MRLKNGNKKKILNCFLLNKPFACKYTKQYSIITVLQFYKNKERFFQPSKIMCESK